jgi:hypothetical protein
MENQVIPTVIPTVSNSLKYSAQLVSNFARNNACLSQHTKTCLLAKFLEQQVSKGGGQV